MLRQNFIFVQAMKGTNRPHAANFDFIGAKRLWEMWSALTQLSTAHPQCYGMGIVFKAKDSRTKAERRGPRGSLFSSRWMAT